VKALVSQDATAKSCAAAIAALYPSCVEKPFSTARASAGKAGTPEIDTFQPGTRPELVWGFVCQAKLVAPKATRRLYVCQLRQVQLADC
jgi:hypothetical protein